MVFKNELIKGNCYYQIRKITENKEHIFFFKSYVYVGNYIINNQSCLFCFQEANDYLSQGEISLCDVDSGDEFSGLILTTEDNLRTFFDFKTLVAELNAIQSCMSKER